MLISTETGSGQIVAAAGDARFYDDVGCLAADWPAHQREATAFVRIGQQWREAGAVSFARPAVVRTAMGSGIVAFERADDAGAADRTGRALGWGEVVEFMRALK